VGWQTKKAFFKYKKAAVAFAAKQRGFTPEMLRKPVEPRELFPRFRALSPVVNAVPFDIQDLLNRGSAAPGMFRRVTVLTPLVCASQAGPTACLDAARVEGNPG